jgi:hypothetical protein
MATIRLTRQIRIWQMIVTTILLALIANSVRLLYYVFADFAVQSSRGSELTLSEEVIDLPNIHPGETGTAKFAIRNTSSAKLGDITVVPSCGCTVVSDVVSSLAPGAEATAELELNTNGLRGRREVTLLVSHSVRGIEKAQTALVRCNVLPFVTVEPRQVRFNCGDRPNGPRLETRVTLQSDFTPEFEIKNLSSSHPAVYVNEVPLLLRRAISK